MAARDFYHETVKQALIADGWSITHDPYFVQMGKLKGFIDLGAELLAAERDTSRIAVEIKNFLGLSDLNEFKEALGQYLLYSLALLKKEPERTLFLAIPKTFYQDFFEDPFFGEVLERYALKIVVFDELHTKIVLWKP
jgi:hypothetical protein